MKQLAVAAAALEVVKLLNMADGQALGREGGTLVCSVLCAFAAPHPL